MKSALLSFLLFCLGFINGLQAQNITGTWEGYMEEEFIQVNIEQRGNILCGYTYDYELRNKASHCVATFEGYYEPANRQYYIAGRRFVENSGSHVRMRMIFSLGIQDAKTVLMGQVTTAREGGFSPGRVDMKLRRVSGRPQQLAGIVEPCFPTPPRPAVKKPAPRPPAASPPAATVKPAQPKTTPAKPSPPAVRKPNPPAARPVPAKPVPAKPAPQPVPPVAQKPLPAKRDTTLSVIAKSPGSGVQLREREIVQNMKLRKQSEQNRLEVNVRKINLKVFDNGTIDNDTVSIFYNGRLLLSHQRLSETAVELDIELKEGVEQHEIIMYAENLGGIPPNTALIVVTAGDKRYELRSKASLEENAVLVITYKPKPF